MSVFNQAELAYLTEPAEGPKLARLATIDDTGAPNVVPVGWSYNPDLDSIDIGGHDFAATRKFRNVQHNTHVGLVIDEVLPPWRPRAVQVRGIGEALDAAVPANGGPAQPMIRITVDKVVSWGLDSS